MSDKGAALQNPWFWGILGLGAVVLLANGFLVFFSLSSFPGLVVQDFYERGTNLPARSQQQKRMVSELAWRVQFVEPGTIKVDTLTHFETTVFSKDGKPLETDRVEIFAYRPSDSQQDFSVILEGKGEGRYGSEFSFPFKGIWDIILEIENSQGKYEIAKRVTVS